MAGQTRLVYVLALVLLLTAAYCATRPITSRVLRRRFEADVDAMHVVMGPAMAAMLVGRLGAEWNRAVVVVCVAGVAWFGSRTIRDGVRSRPGGGRPGHQAQHLVACAAMLYMLGSTSVGAMGGMGAGTGPAPGTGPAAVPVMSSATGPSVPIKVLAVALGAVLIAYAAWDLGATRASPGEPGTMIASAGTRPMLAPRVAAGCQALMCLAMGGMVMATV